MSKNKKTGTGWPSKVEYASWYKHYDLKASNVIFETIPEDYYWNADPNKCTYILTPDEYNNFYPILKTRQNIAPDNLEKQIFPSKNIEVCTSAEVYMDGKFFPNQPSIKVDASFIIATPDDIDINFIPEERGSSLLGFCEFGAAFVLSSLIGVTTCYLLNKFYFDTDYEG